MSTVIALGQYSGGELWVETPNPTSDCVPPPSKRGAQDDGLLGRRYHIHHKWLAFHPHCLHTIYPVTEGTRYSVVLYNPGHLDQVPESVWSRLGDLGFPVRAFQKRDYDNNIHVFGHMLESDLDFLDHVSELADGTPHLEAPLPQPASDVLSMEAHYREGHFPKNPECVVCQRESGSKVDHRSTWRHH
eukprot:4225755-Amphidinium_carterae.1